MAESRVQKYKDYRNSLIKEGSPVLETPESSMNKKSSEIEINTTSALPIDEVMSSMNGNDAEDVFLKRANSLRRLKIILVIAAIVLVIAAITIFGIIVWSK